MLLGRDQHPFGERTCVGVTVRWRRVVLRVTRRTHEFVDRRRSSQCSNNVLRSRLVHRSMAYPSSDEIDESCSFQWTLGRVVLQTSALRLQGVHSIPPSRCGRVRRKARRVFRSYQQRTTSGYEFEIRANWGTVFDAKGSSIGLLDR